MPRIMAYREKFSVFFPPAQGIVHTNPSRKRSFWKNLFKPEEFENDTFRFNVYGERFENRAFRKR